MVFTSQFFGMLARRVLTSVSEETPVVFTFQDGKVMTEISEYDVSGYPISNFQGCATTPDGTQIFIIDTNADLMRELTLSTAWDLTSVTDNTRASTTLNNCADVSSENGLDWYFVNGISNQILHHVATTAWDITTISGTATATFSMSTITNSLGCFVTGKYLYVSGQTNLLQLYDISSGVSSATLVDTFTCSFSPQAVVSSPDGKTVYLSDIGNDVLVEVSVPLGFGGFTGASEQGTTIDLTAVFGSTNSRGMAIDRTNGDKFVFSDIGSDKVHTCSLAPPTSWDISTATFVNGWNDSSSPASFQYTQSVYFNTTGTKMFVLWASDTTVREYSLSTAWDLSNASVSASATYATPANQDAIDDITFNSGGTEMYVCDRNDDVIYRYELSTGFDLSSVTGQNANTLDVSSYETDARGVDVVESGGSYYFYVVGRNSDQIHRFVLTSWGGTPTVTSSVSLSGIVTGGCEADYSGVRVKPDGSKIYVCVAPRTGTKAMNILEFDMSTPYDITSGSLGYNQAFDAPNNSGSSPNNIDGWVSGFFIRLSDGIKLYISDLNLQTSNSPYDLYEFTMS